MLLFCGQSFPANFQPKTRDAGKSLGVPFQEEEYEVDYIYFSPESQFRWQHSPSNITPGHSQLSDTSLKLKVQSPFPEFWGILDDMPHMEWLPLRSAIKTDERAI